MTAENDSKAQDAARSAGLEKMAAQFPDDVARAFEFAKTLADRLPRDIAPTDEPAHVFRAGESGK